MRPVYRQVVLTSLLRPPRSQHACQLHRAQSATVLFSFGRQSAYRVTHIPGVGVDEIPINAILMGQLPLHLWGLIAIGMDFTVRQLPLTVLCANTNYATGRDGDLNGTQN